MPGERIAILGAGTLGLCTLAAIRQFSLPSVVISAAKHPVQRRFAAELGADVIVKPAELGRGVRRITGTLALSSDAGAIDRLAGGADAIFDCVGSASSINQSLEVVRPGGQRRPRRYARLGPRRPRAAVAARDLAHRYLRLRH